MNYIIYYLLPTWLKNQQTITKPDPLTLIYKMIAFSIILLWKPRQSFYESQERKTEKTCCCFFIAPLWHYIDIPLIDSKVVGSDYSHKKKKGCGAPGTNGKPCQKKNQ